MDEETLAHPDVPVFSEHIRLPAPMHIRGVLTNATIETLGHAVLAGTYENIAITDLPPEVTKENLDACPPPYMKAIRIVAYAIAVDVN